MTRDQVVGLWLSVLAYLGVSTLWFGDPLSPLWLALVWPDRVGNPNWKQAPVFCVATTAIPMLFILRPYVRPTLLLPLVVATSFSLSVIAIGLYAEHRRQEVISEFGADEVIRSSFFQSIREAPRDFQFFLHAAALKNGVCYGWSYRENGFYVLPPNVAKNVLPLEWLPKCSIERK